MVNFPGRTGRRRRVLNEELLSASGARAAREAGTSSEFATQAPRYSDAAGVENHPQVTDFVPRRYWTIGMLVASGFMTAGVLGALHYFAQTVAAFAGLPSLRPFDLGAPGSLGAWVGAVLMLFCSAVCLLIYSIRRHRIDDFRGRYRVWLAASVACLVMSGNSVSGLHQVVAHSLSHFTGWTALRDGAAWWLVVGGAPLAWIGVRAMLDVKECRLAGVFGGAAAVCFAFSAVVHIGSMPGMGPRLASLMTGVAMTLGYWLLLATVVSYARFVILDAQGLISVRKTATKKQKQKQEPAIAAEETEVAKTKPTVLSVVNYSRNKASRSQAEESDKWVDGRRPERKSYETYDEEDEESDGGSKLTKADRKRMRKIKAQNRAA